MIRSLILLICLFSFFPTMVLCAGENVDGETRLARVFVKTEHALEEARSRADSCDSDSIANVDISNCVWTYYEDMLGVLNDLVVDSSLLAPDDLVRTRLQETVKHWQEWIRAEDELYLYYSAGRGSGAGIFTAEKFIPKVEEKIKDTKEELSRYFQQKKGWPPSSFQKKLTQTRQQMALVEKLCPDYESDEGPRRTPEGCARAISILRDILGEKHPSLAVAYTSRGETLLTQGRPEDALSAYEQALKIYSNREEPDTFALAGAHASVGDALFQKREYPQALDAYKEAFALLQKADDPDLLPSKRYPAQEALAKIDGKILTVLLFIGDGTQIEDQFEKAMTSCRTMAGSFFCEAELYRLMGEKYARDKDLPRAREEYRRALDTILFAHLHEFIQMRWVQGYWYQNGLAEDRRFLEEFFAVLTGPEHQATRNGYEILWDYTPLDLLLFMFSGRTPEELCGEKISLLMGETK